MRIAITADLQLDLYERYSKPHAKWVTTRLADMMDCWNWMLSEAEDCGQLVVVGDIFDNRTHIELPVLDAACEMINRAAAAFDVVYVLAGNHDSYLRDTTITSIRVLGRQNVEVITSPRQFGDYWFVPWSDDGEDFADSIAACTPTSRGILFSHVLLTGAVARAKGLDVGVLQASRWRRVFLGDVHKPMEMLSNVLYVGSPMQIDYRDAGEIRGFVKYDVDADEVDYVENTVSPKFHLVKTDEDATEVADLVRAGEGVLAGDFARVEVDAEEVTAALREAGLRVESKAVRSPAAPPRLDVTVSDSHAAALAKYVQHQKVEDADAVVAAGLEILDEAKG